jgi:outer membrane protein assembly factor BamA
MVKDKHSWVIAPAFYNQPTNVGGGVGFGENNLFGKNQKLLIYGQIATGDSFFIGAWVIPALGGTRFYAQLDTYLKTARNIEYASPTRYAFEDSNDDFAGASPKALRESRIHYLNFGAKLGIELFRGFKIDSRLRAASVSYKDIKLAQFDSDGDGKPDMPVPMEKVVGDPTMPMPVPSCIDPEDPLPPPGCEGADVSNEWSLTIDRRANYYGIQSGYRYTVSLERSLTALGSDFDYWLAGLSIYRAKRLFEKHNFVIKGSINKGKNLPFQQEYKTGGTSMRGWLNDQFRGDFKSTLNVEYSLPIFPTIKGLSIRGLLFFDSAYTTFFDADAEKAKRHYLPGAEVRGMTGFKNTIGVGTRFYLRQIVLPLLGLDFGYGLEARDFQVYLAIGLTD